MRRDCRRAGLGEKQEFVLEILSLRYLQFVLKKEYFIAGMNTDGNYPELRKKLIPEKSEIIPGVITLSRSQDIVYKQDN